MGSVHQTYADVIFEAASHRLGRQVAAPQVLRGFDDEPESEPVASQPESVPPAAYATEAPSKSSYPPSTTSTSSSTSSSPTSVSYSPSPTILITNLIDRVQRRSRVRRAS